MAKLHGTTAGGIKDKTPRSSATQHAAVDYSKCHLQLYEFAQNILIELCIQHMLYPWLLLFPQIKS